jgi:hypothetical protein
MRVGGPKVLINIAHSSRMYFASDIGTIRSLATRQRAWSTDETATLLPCSARVPSETLNVIYVGNRT